MQLDSVTLEILATKVAATAEEMGIALQRSGRTIYVKETQDFGTGLVNRRGKLFCFPTAVGVCNMVDNDAGPVIAAVPDLEPGDVIITNHPYMSVGLATHLPDLHLLQPYFHKGEIVCYGWCFIHSADVGGRVPSSISPSNNEIFQEGLMIPPLKLVKARHFNSDVVAFIAANCRTAEENLGDLKAMVGSLGVGERRIAAMIAQHGVDAVLAAADDVIAYSAARARNAFRTIPDGVYEFHDYLDDDLVSAVPVRIRAKLTASDGMLAVDFTGTDPQVAAAFNIPTMGKRHPWLTLRLLQYAVTRDPTIPLNSGILDPVSVTIPEGSLLNPVFPASVGVRHATGNRMIDVISGMLVQAVPDFMRAAGCGLTIPVVLAEPPDVTGKRKVDVVEPVTGGTGGRLGQDGIDGRDSSTSGMSNNPLESVEAAAALTVHRYGTRPDSGGPGRWRGGTGVELTFSPHLSGSQVLGRGMERFRFVPWGLAGGRCGTGSRTIKNFGRHDEQELGKIDMLDLEPTDTITVMSPGGGGYGNPLERDPVLVLQDVRRGFVSEVGALRDYGVVVVEGTIDVAATEAERAGRKTTPRGLFDFGRERDIWDSVFDDEFMRRLDVLLSRQPATARQEQRKRLLAPLFATLRRDEPFGIDALQAARMKCEALLERAELPQPAAQRTISLVSPT